MASDFLSVIHPGRPERPATKTVRRQGLSCSSCSRYRVVSPCCSALDCGPGKFDPADPVSRGRKDHRGGGAARRAHGRAAAQDLACVGTLATVHKVVKMPNQSLFVFTEGTERVKLAEFSQIEPFMTASVEVGPKFIRRRTLRNEALQRNVLTQFQQIVTASPTLSDELQTIAMNIDEPGRLVDFIASSLPFLATTDKQELLETPDVARAWSGSTSIWQKKLKCSSCATRSRPKCRTRCSSRSGTTTCASR